ncbi:hypothetical protein F31_0003 [Escherichia phage vB_Eco_F31]|nr:hypothetical protein F31_0003 [Escherichia phage vB_Eco_F31]
MKVMFIPSRAVPFNPERVQGGLEAVHLNVLKYLVSIGADIDYIGFDNDTFGDWKVNHHPVGHLTKFSLGMSYTMARKIVELAGIHEYDFVVTMEPTKLTVQAIKDAGLSKVHKNFMATPFEPVSRGIVQIWDQTIQIHKNGGKSYAPTKAFREFERKYCYMTSGLTDKIDYDYWRANPLFEAEDYPVICLNEKPEVLPATDLIISAQRYDTKMRRTDVALEAIKALGENGIGYCPSKWAPPAKYPVIIDAPHSEIMECLKTAKALINTCPDTGTVENSSIEAISKGVPVIQLVFKDYPHATFEYDPDTVRVEIDSSTPKKEVVALYTKAVLEFTDTYEARVKRAEAVWKKYNRDAVVAMWDKIFTA